MKRTSLAVAVLLGWSSIAAAQDDGLPPPPETAPAEASPPAVASPVVAPMPPPIVESETKPKEKNISVTFAPILLVVPLVEITGEYRVARKLGVSITLGAGRRTVSDDMFGDATGTEIVAGAQVRYYAIGSFRHGMEIGAQVLEEYVKFDEPLPPNIIAIAAGGLTVGAFLGYKIATGVGFTFEAQVGARYLVVEPEQQGSGGGSFEEEKWQPLAHVNIGWSF